MTYKADNYKTGDKAIIREEYRLVLGSHGKYPRSGYIGLLKTTRTKN